MGRRQSLGARRSSLACRSSCATRAPGAGLVLIGGPGVGKTTLWETAIGSARAEGVRVLTVRPSESTEPLPFSGLVDLCDQLGEEEFAPLPGPQRSALEAALLRAEHAPEPGALMAISLGLLGVVRRLAARDAVLVAIDDLQWLDPSSAEALMFVVRRLEGVRVGFLLVRRPGGVGALEAVLSRASLERMRVGPLSVGAVRRLLFERLGLTISRQRLRRLVEATDGNPLFALEIGRSLLEDTGSIPERDLPLPDSLEEVLGERVGRLSATVRSVLLALALSEEPHVDRLLGIIDADALEEAVEAGVVVIDGVRVRAAHPLLGAAAEQRASGSERRAVHDALAAVAADERSRAMHLALASRGPDGPLAVRVAAAAEQARVHGSRRQASLLAAEALRLTPPGGADRPERVLELAGRLDDAGELRRMTVLLNEELGSLPPGPPRARAWLLLSEGEEVRSRQDQDRYLERALMECGEQDRDLRAHILAKKAGNAAAGAVSQLGAAEAWALEALDGAENATARRYALYSLAWPLAMSGRPLGELCARSSVAGDPSAYISASPERVEAKRLVWRGELARARASLDSLAALADERGDLTSYAMVRMHRVEVELRSGEFNAAQLLLEEWGESSDYETQFRPQYPRCRALLATGRGEAEEAGRWARETILLAQATGSTWDELEARRALGMTALLEQTLEGALAELSMVWAHCEREGVLDPGVFPVAPDLVEALVELERFEDAEDVVDRVAEEAVRQDHPWGRATASRCRAVLRLVGGGYDEADAALMRQAAADLARLESRFDAARCLLTLGRAQRRFKQWRAARETLEETIAAFDRLGAPGWVLRARAELERVGGRRRAAGGLTASERRVVELAAQGLSNKEIAASLYVTVNTVEVHLAHAYPKLGVHSRGQLAKRLAAGQ